MNLQLVEDAVINYKRGHVSLETVMTAVEAYSKASNSIKLPVSSIAGARKCIDCGIEDTTVKKRSDGSGDQCYKCYKDELYFEDEYK